MNERIPRLARAVILAAGLLIVGLPSAAGEQPAVVHPDWERWQRLELVVRDAFLFSGRFEMARDTRGELTRLETSASARLLGARIARSRSTSVLDERTGVTRSHLRLSKQSGRRFDFDETGYDVVKLRSNSFETEPARWESVRTTRFDCPPIGPAAEDDAAGVEVEDSLLDSYGMLLHLRFRDLDSIGDRATVRVASKRGPVMYEVVVIERRRGTRSVRLGADSRRVTLELDELRLLLKPADPDHDEATFLDMEGETELWVEAHSKAPVEIRGRIPRVGRVSIVLDRLVAPAGRD